MWATFWLPDDNDKVIYTMMNERESKREREPIFILAACLFASCLFVFFCRLAKNRLGGGGGGLIGEEEVDAVAH